MTRYASNTKVSTDKSRAEIEKTLRRYGATSFAYGWEDQRALIGFQAHGRRIRFILPLPDVAEKEFCFTPTGKTRSDPETERLWEKACRQRWRALALVIKAKLEAVESGIAEFEDEFLAYVMLPNGKTVGEWVRPQVASGYKNGIMPKLLPMSSEVEG